MELANILELIHAVSDSDLTEFNLQDDTLNISMSKEKTNCTARWQSILIRQMLSRYQP